MKVRFLSPLGVLLTFLASTHADQLQMLNGDRYFGRVMSISSNTVVWQSDVLGSVTLPREKITSITFGTNAATKSISLTPARPTPAKAPANRVAGAQTVPTQLRTSPHAVKEIEEQYLAGASPEAKAKFNEMVNGLMSGQLTVTDIRAQAKTAADQLRTARRDLGEEAGEALDGYLAILDSFLRETESGAAPAPKAAPQPSKPKTVPDDE
jgi:hypothetical protein